MVRLLIRNHEDVSPAFVHDRQYCTRKLHRLYKAVKMTHGRGKYLPRKLDVSTVTEVG